MGSRDAKCYLASPEVVAASAVAGYIRGHSKVANREVARVYEEFPAGAATEKVEILPGFPARLKGRLVFLPQDNVNTDAIYGKDYTYRDDVTPETMAKVVMEHTAAIRRANALRRRGGQRLQFWHGIEPRAGSHLPEGEGIPW